MNAETLSRITRRMPFVVYCAYRNAVVVSQPQDRYIFWRDFYVDLVSRKDLPYATY